MLPLFDLAHLLARRGVAVTVAVSSGNLPLLSPLLSKSPSIQPLSLPSPTLPRPGPRERQGHGPDLLRHPDARPRLPPRPLVSWPGPTQARLRRRLRLLRGLGPAPRRRARRPRLRLLPSGVLGTAVIHSLFLRVPRGRERGRGRGLPRPLPLHTQFPSYPCPSSPASSGRTRKATRSPNPCGATSSGTSRATASSRTRSRRSRRPTWSARSTISRGSGCGGGAPGRRRAEAGAADHRGGPSSVPAAEVSAWLDRFPEGSVVYVCFGSLAVLTPAQAAAAAAALERSGAAFVWRRGGHGGAEGFEERVGGGGWCCGVGPQVAILAHAAVGWFVTHCGWNSLVEAASAGVAMLTWPMTADQHVNARLLVEEAGVALPACDGGLAAVPDPHELARTLAEAVRGERGRAVRDRAKELGRKAVEAVREGGSSYRALEEFVQELHNLNAKNN
ncbi:UDP-glycosyltransferase 89B1 [Ananas comosus]|uniref:UDP-glycosyltransferase 89B1 n=1 Tax=Ananas comosus TaxID=4615 RepID=A0A199VMG8_ANACO|nr:UDP-glycosyltransferase 89B1 [Ananas comosus]